MDESRLAVLRKDATAYHGIRSHLRSRMRDREKEARDYGKLTGSATRVLWGLFVQEAHKAAAEAYERKLAELEGKVG